MSYRLAMVGNNKVTFSSLIANIVYTSLIFTKFNNTYRKAFCTERLNAIYVGIIHVLVRCILMVMTSDLGRNCPEFSAVVQIFTLYAP
jgi:hypothetical protein